MLVTIGDIRLVIILDYRVCGLGISLSLTTGAALSASLTTSKSSQFRLCRRDS
jgi:hypothetical protein